MQWCSRLVLFTVISPIVFVWVIALLLCLSSTSLQAQNDSASIFEDIKADSANEVLWSRLIESLKAEQANLNFEAAHAWADSAIAVGKLMPTSFQRFEPMRLKGVLLVQEGKLSEALSIYRSILANHKILPNHLVARVHYNVGNVFNSLRRYDNALLSFNQAWQMLEQDTGEHLNKINILHNVAYLYLSKEQYDSCEVAFERLFEYERYHSFEGLPLNVLRNYAFFLMRTGSFAQAKLYLDSILSSDKKYLTPLIKGATYQAYGELYNLMEKPALALLSLGAVDKILKSGNNQPLKVALTLQRYKAYKLLGNYALALEQYERYTALQDTLNNEIEDELYASLMSGMQKIADNFEKQAYEARASLLKNQSESEKRVRLYLILILALAGIVLLLLAIQLNKGLKQKNELQAAVLSRTEVIREQLKELELKNSDLLKATNELNSFLYSASHDLRAPIASLLGLVQVARISIENPKELLQYFMLQDQTLRRMDDVIHGLMDFAEHKNRTIQRSSVDLKEFIQSVLNDFSFHPMHAPMECICTIHLNRPFHTDRSRLLLVMRNLIQNAYKYANPQEPKPFLHIEGALREDGLLELKVTDNGVGISEDNQLRVFEMFYRASSKKQGSGLGLYICKETVEKLGGTLTLESKVGVGTTLTMLLPELHPEEKQKDDSPQSA